MYEYTFASGQLTQITQFSNEFAGHFSISPDGQTIVFERAASTEALTNLWIMNRDGSNMRLLARNAARPAWSSRAPQVVAPTTTPVPSSTPVPSTQPFKAFLPLTIR